MKENEIQRIEALIEGYFDGALSPEEACELDRALAADPEAARRFVRAARFDNDLNLFYHRRAAEIAAADALARAQREGRSQRPRWARAVDHIWGPFGAILAHAALLLILIRWVVVPLTRPSPPVEVSLQAEERLELDTLRRELASPPRSPEGLPVLEPPPLIVQAPDGGAAAPAPAFVEPPPALADRGGRLWGEPAWMRGRTPSARAERLARYAPEWAELTEPALDGALNWLARARRSDGGWSASESEPLDPGLTALALLAAFARGESLTKLQTAVSGLAETQQPDGGFPTTDDRDALGPAACALIEAYARAPLPPLRFAAQRAIEAILREQTEVGLWRDDDPWTTSWRILALRTAAWAGLGAKDLRPGLARAVGGLKTFEDPARALFRGARPSARAVERTAATALALQWLGEGRAPETRSALSALGRIRPNAPDAEWSPFALHLLAQARFNEGGEAWSRSRAALAEALLAGRADDGGWQAESGGDAARIRATALSALSMTVCYRYPPAAEWPALAARLSPARAPVIAWAAFPIPR